MTGPACDCGRPSEFTDGSEVYRHLPELHHKRFWICRECNAYVGCHPGTDKPLGSLAGPSLRQARVKTHAALDPIWRGGLLSRNRVYKHLSRQLGFEVHVGQADEATCEKIIAECQRLRKELGR